MNEISRRGAAALAAASLSACSLTGCAPSVQKSGINCGWVTGPEATGEEVAKAADNVAVLVDVSASFWSGKENARRPDVATIVAESLAARYSEPGTRIISFGTFDGSSATIGWRLTSRVLPKAAGSDKHLTRKQKDIQDRCLKPETAGLAAVAPAAAGSDPLAALAAAAKLTSRSAARARRIVVVTDGLANAGCLDLRAVLKQGESADKIVQSCPAKNELALLADAQVKFIGIGLQSDRAPIGSIQHSWLKNYWSDMCAQLKVNDPDCLVAQVPTVQGASSVARPDDPAVTFPPVTGAAVQIPEALLFAHDSDRLSGTAKSYLEALAEQIRSQGRRVTEVIGHTDSSGGADYNVGLSMRRAKAVNEHLAALGLGGATPRGLGAEQRICTTEYRAGRPDAACMARNRRVELKLGG